MSAPLLPEFIGILGIDIFLILSILTCLFDFPTMLQYAYHIGAFVGFGQLWVNYAFALNEEIRFLICVAYVVIGLANVIFINGYIGSHDRKILWTTALLCCITIPAILVSFWAVSSYVNRIAISLPWLPLMPPEVIAAILLMCGIVLATSLILSSFMPNLLGSSISKKKKGGERANEVKQR
jgi:hypothetical protein